MINNDLPAISVIIPVKNEVDSIPELINRLKDTLIPISRAFELIFIDDYSTDGTGKVICSLSVDERIQYRLKKHQPGKAQSLLEGFSYAQYENIVMIDSDLQYPPEAIKNMLTKMEEGYDVVIAERKISHTNLLRQIFSKTFKFLFSKSLHGMNFDVQSGLKLFKKEIIERISLHPSPWTFDLEFLVSAKAAGYRIGGQDITFEKRKNGSSKINMIHAIFQIGLSAILLKLKSPEIIPFHQKKIDKVGQGFHYKSVEFIHFSDLHTMESAVKTLLFHQLLGIVLFIMLFISGLVIDWKLTIIMAMGVVTFLYFLDLLFNLYLIYRSFSKSPEITVSEQEIQNVDDWPRYTIFCPLYREWVVVPQFVKAIQDMDYPKDKLQVQLLLEEDDTESIGHIHEMSLPNYFEIIVVPNSLPKTKPKACNYGLKHATGEFSVIYDAEDIPDPKQLKKAVLAFQKGNENLACVQAKLNYYNHGQNLLTRLFTAEYSLWFDLILTGLQSLKAPIPLGGTSNHFQTKRLREVHGWDSFNVTEDCDLGIRLTKKGYATAIVDSITLEEANSNFYNWINQRSRWIKGYIQTYLVHMRNPGDFFKRGNIAHFFMFQLIVGGKILSLFINPLMWALTILYFSLRLIVGSTIEQFFPGPVFYMAVFSLIFGNFLYIYYYMIGCAKKKQFDLIKYIYLIPFYWIAMSIAAWKGVFQLVFNPHYWPKTVHGLHLEKSVIASVANSQEIGFDQKLLNIVRLRTLRRISIKGSYLTGLLLIASSALANILNFAFNALLGRALTFSEFAQVSFMTALYSFTSIIASSLGASVNYRAGVLIGNKKPWDAFLFWVSIRRRSLHLSVAIAVIWIIAIPFLKHFFHVDDVFFFLLFTPILIVALIHSSDRGILSANFNFGRLALLNICEPVIKMVTAIVCVYIGIQSFSYISVPVAIISVTIFGWFLLTITKKPIAEKENQLSRNFPTKFFIASLISGFSTVIFLSLDVIFAKMFLNTQDAGIYALAALIGKIVYFLGSLVSPFIIPLVSRNEGAKQDSRKILYLTLISTTILSLPAVIAFGIFGSITAPLLFGNKAIITVPYLLPLTLGMLGFTMSRVLTEYYLARKYFSFTLASFGISLMQIMLLIFFHKNLSTFVAVMSGSWIAYTFSTVILHVFSQQVKIIENNILDFLNLFGSYSAQKPTDVDKSRILIFNWRDTKHIWAGGAETYLHEISKRLVKAGHSVTIFCGNSGKSPRNEMVEGIHIYRRGGFYMVYIWAFLYYIFRFKGKFDVIIDSENGIPFFTPLYAQEKTYLLIHHVHQEVFRKSLKWPFSWIASILEAKIMPAIYRKVQVITVSPSSKIEILKHQLTQIEPMIIYNGVNAKEFKPGIKHSKPLIVYIGRIQFYKSLHVFIKSAKIILEKIPDAEFVIAGNGEEKNNLEQFAEKLGLSNKIRFLGHISHHEKIKLFQKAWVFLNPSFMEGWGITTIEANACGTPAVASNVPGLMDSIQNPHTGFLVPYGNADMFAEKVVSLIEDKDLYKNMSNASVAWAKRFDWDTSEKAYSNLFAKPKNETLQKKLTIAFFDMDSLKNPYWAAGQARATREVGKQLAKNHNVIVYTSKYPGCEDYIEEGIQYKHIGINSRSSKLTNIAFIPTIPYHVRKIHADVIIEEFNAPCSVSFSPLFTKTPVIALPTMFAAEQFTKKYHIPFHLIEKIGLKYYKYMLCYSDIDCTKAKKLNPQIKTEIVPQGVGKEYIDIKQQPPEYILFLGRFDIEQKGLDLMLRAYALVKDKMSYPLVLAGHGPDESKIRNLIAELELSSRVTIVGSAYADKKRELMSKALYTIFPSRHDEMSLWALESLAGGLPLVCFDLPESNWITDDVSFKAPMFDVEIFSMRMLEATNTATIHQKRSNSRNFAKKYTWEHVANEFESFIYRVLLMEDIKI